MYESRTFENLQEEMRDEAMIEGTMIDAAIAKQAVRLEEAYADMDNINENMLVDTQDREHLIDSGAECGLPLIEGTPASVRAVMNCQCEVGDEFTATDSEFNYVVVQYLGTIDIEDVPWYRYELEADDTGVEPGQYRGDIEPIDDVPGFEQGYIDATITAGTDDEDTEDYRDRRLNAFASQACAGNRAYYHDTIHDNFQVGGVKSARRTDQEGATGLNSSVGIWIQGADYGTAGATLISDVEDAMDPDGTDGEGMGLNPFGSVLTIQSVTGVNIAVTATFTFDTGYTFAGLKTAIEEAVDGYLLTLRKTWEDDYEELWEENAGIVVRISHIEAAIITVEGVLDVTDTTINGDDENIILENTEIPILTGVSENG